MNLIKVNETVIVYTHNGQLRHYDKDNKLLYIEYLTFSPQTPSNYWVDCFHNPLFQSDGEITDKDIQKAFQILALKNIESKELDMSDYAWIQSDGTYIKAYTDDKGHIYKIIKNNALII